MAMKPKKCSMKKVAKNPNAFNMKAMLKSVMKGKKGRDMETTISWKMSPDYYELLWTQLATELFYQIDESGDSNLEDLEKKEFADFKQHLYIQAHFVLEDVLQDMKKYFGSNVADSLVALLDGDEFQDPSGILYKNLQTKPFMLSRSCKDQHLTKWFNELTEGNRQIKEQEELERLKKEFDNTVRQVKVLANRLGLEAQVKIG